MALPNTERNKELVFKRLSDPIKWSYGELGKFYKIHKTTAEEIFLRDKMKYSQEFDSKISKRRELSTV